MRDKTASGKALIIVYLLATLFTLDLAQAGDFLTVSKGDGFELKCRVKKNSPITAVPAPENCGTGRKHAPKVLCTMQLECEHTVKGMSGNGKTLTEGVASCLGGGVFNVSAGKAVTACPDVDKCVKDTRVDLKILNTTSEIPGSVSQPAIDDRYGGGAGSAR